MDYKMKHQFKDMCYSIDRLFDKVDGMSTFMRSLERQGLENIDMNPRDVYVGAGLEALVEVLIACSPLSKFINCINYVPVQEDDMGVDGFGYGHDGEVHTVQVKYRGNTNQVLTANKDHLSNFVAHSKVKYEAKHMTIFTTAKELHRAIAEEMYQGKVRTIGYDELRRLVDKNQAFWTIFRNSMKF